MRLIPLLLTLAAALSAQEIVPGRYIVEFEGAPAIESRDRVAARAEVRVSREDALAQLQTRGARVQRTIETVANAAIVESADRAALEATPGVKKVHAVRLLQLSLDRAALLHRFDRAWESIGGQSKAGEGVKIAILDTGILANHPGFAPPEGMVTADGFPQVSPELNRTIIDAVKAKIIVARSYDGGVITDRNGHGTSTAMTAAGVPHAGPYGQISGVAPRAWIGVYKVNPGSSNSIPTDYALSALEDAVNDGMHVINMSFGFVGLAGPENDVLAQSAERAAARGVTVVIAAGNDGPEQMTVDDSAADSKVLAVGATRNDRAVTTPAVLPSAGATIFAAVSTDATSRILPVASGRLIDFGRGCNSDEKPASVAGLIPLIIRGDCNFSEKLANAARAGATAAIVYNSPTAEAPEAVVNMNVDGAESIPGLFIANSAGERLKSSIADDFEVRLRFALSGQESKSMASFSSLGPAVNLAIKPDLVAVGNPVVTASVDNSAADGVGWTQISGTSFSAPLVAGAAAVVRGARPGLEEADYRSLLVNATKPFILSDGTIAPVQVAGAGYLDLMNSMQATLTAQPLSLSYGAGGGTVDASKSTSFKNVGTDTVTCALTVESTQAVKPALSTTEVRLGPLQRTDVQVSFTGGGLAAGAYEGFVTAQCAGNPVAVRVPYWYAVKAEKPVTISIPGAPTSGRRLQETVVYVRLLDSSGVPLTTEPPVVEALTEGASVAGVELASDAPGSYAARVRVTEVTGIQNQFVVKAAGLEKTFTLRSTF